MKKLISLHTSLYGTKFQEHLSWFSTCNLPGTASEAVLTHLFSMHPFSTSFSGGRERVHWEQEWVNVDHDPIIEMNE